VCTGEDLRRCRRGPPRILLVFILRGLKSFFFDTVVRVFILKELQFFFCLDAKARSGRRRKRNEVLYSDTVPLRYLGLSSKKWNEIDLGNRHASGLIARSWLRKGRSRPWWANRGIPRLTRCGATDRLLARSFDGTRAGQTNTWQALPYR
jgi:hypothetical protein